MQRKALIVTTQRTLLDGSAVLATAVVGPDDARYPALLKAAFRRQSLFGEPVAFAEPDEPELAKIASRPKGLFGFAPGMAAQHEAKEQAYDAKHTQMSSSTPPGMHWITIHPNNAGEGHGRPVLVGDDSGKIEAGLPPKVMEQINNHEPESRAGAPPEAPPSGGNTGAAAPAPPSEPPAALEPAGEPPAPVPLQRQEPGPIPSAPPEPAPLPAPAPAPEMTPPQAGPTEAPPSPGDNASLPPPPPDAAGQGHMAPAETPSTGEELLPGAAPPEANPGPDSGNTDIPPGAASPPNLESPSPESSTPETSAPQTENPPEAPTPEPEAQNPQTEDPGEAPSLLTPSGPEEPAPPHEGHLAHAAILRDRAASAPTPEGAAAYHKAADTLEDIARNPDSLDQHILAHRQAKDRIFGQGGSGEITPAFDRQFGSPEFNEVKDRVKSIAGSRFNGKKFNPDGDNTWRLPAGQLHNAIGALPEFSVNPRLLTESTDLVHRGLMAGSEEDFGGRQEPDKPTGEGRAGELPPPGTSPADAMAATNVAPPDADLPPEAQEPMDTAGGAIFNDQAELAKLPDDDVPWSAAAVAKMKPAGENSAVSDSDALSQYAKELHGRAERLFGQAKNETTRTASEKIKQSGYKLRGLAYDAEEYAQDPRALAKAQERYGYRPPYNKFLLTDGRVSFHQYGGIEADNKYDNNGKKTGNPTLDKLRSLPGFKNELAERGHVSFSPSQLSTAVEHFPSHYVHPDVLVEAARQFARSNAPPPAWEHPPDLKTAAEGGRTLFPFQQYNAALGAHRDRSILSMDMGLGKTLTSLAAFSRRRQMGMSKKCLAIVPVATMHNWRKEVEANTHLKVAVAMNQSDLTPDGKQKPEDEHTQEELLRNADIVVAGYSGMNDTTSRDKVMKEIKTRQDEMKFHHEQMQTAREIGDEKGMRQSEAHVARLEKEIAEQGNPEDASDEDSKLDALMKLGSDSLIIDEAHRLKNPQSKASKAFMEHLQGMPHMQLLTGTPMHNKPQNLHQMIQMVSPNLFGKLPQFIARYVNQREGAQGRSVDTGYKNLDELFHLAKPAMSYLPAGDPHVMQQMAGAGLSIPKRTDLSRDVTMSPAQSKLYDLFREAGTQILSDMQSASEDGESGEAKEKKELLITLGLRMAQITHDPRLLDLSKIPNSEALEEAGGGRAIRQLVNQYASETGGVSPKVAHTADIISDHLTNGGKGAVVYTSYPNGPDLVDRSSGKVTKQKDFHLKLIRDGIIKRGGYKPSEVGVLTTGSPTARQKLIDRYNDPKDPMRIMLITPAANEGVNLQGLRDNPGGGGDLFVRLNREWLYGAEDQADARISRLGQDRPTTHVSLHAVTEEGRPTSDHKMAARINQKRKVGDKVLENKGESNEIAVDSGFDVKGKEQSGAGFDMDDLTDLFGGR